MNFKAVISHDAIQDIIKSVSHVSDEVRVQISPTGIKIQAVDPANVCMVFLEAPSDAFEYFKADQGELALDLTRLDKFTEGNDSVSMELDPETHKMKVVTGKAKYNMSLIDPTAIKANPRIPQLDMPASISISGGDLKDAIKAAGKVSDHVIFEQGDETFSFSAKGDIDSAKIDFPLVELIGIKPGMSRALFSLEYMDEIVKVAAKVSEVKIETGIDYPCIVSFSLGKITIRYLVAPRIEQE